MGLSSQSLAGGGVQHRAGEEGQADGYEQKVEHGVLSFRAIASLG
jgi:hypothetical protein